MENLRTCDIMVWSSVRLEDVITESMGVLDSLHVNLVMKGKEFDRLALSPSPSHTYITYRFNRLNPIEKIIDKIKVTKGGNSIYILKRVGGKEVDKDILYKHYMDCITSPLHNKHDSFRDYAVRCITLNMGLDYEIKLNTYQICSAFTAYLLNKVGLIDGNNDLSMLLPTDFYNLTFYQTEEYEKIEIFNKKAMTINTVFKHLMSNLSLI